MIGCNAHLDEPDMECALCTYDNYVHLTREEAEAIVRELKYTYISHENPMAHKVYAKLEEFVRAWQMNLF